MLPDEGTAFVGLVTKIRPRSSVNLSVSQNPLEQRERTAAAVLDVPLGWPLTPERWARYQG